MSTIVGLDKDAIRRVIASLETENQQQEESIRQSEKLIEENNLVMVALKKRLGAPLESPLQETDGEGAEPSNEEDDEDGDDEEETTLAVNDGLRIRGMHRTDAAALILEKHGGPLSLQEIGDRLNAGGVETWSDNHFTALYIGLDRNYRFSHVSGKGRSGLWGLMKWKLEGGQSIK